MRGKLRLMGLAATIALLSTACLSSGGGGGGGGGTADAGKAEGTVRYVLWDANQLPGYKKCAAAFTAKNPKIQIKIEQKGWDDYWGGLTTSFVAGNAPDVITDHLQKYPEFVKTHQLQPLDDFISRDKVATDSYFPGLFNLWHGEDGKAYGLPKDWDTIAIFYNKKYAKDAGISEQQIGSLTWNPQDGGTYEKTIAHLTVDKNGKRGDEPGFDKNNVKVYGLGLAGGGSGLGQTEWSFLPASMGWQALDKNPWGTHYKYDDPKLIEAITWWRSLIQKGYMPSLAASASGVGLQGTFDAGKYAMVTEGDWQIKTYTSSKNVDVGFAPLPVGPSGKRASMFNGLADSIWAGSKVKEAAWQWVKFLGSADCQNIMAKEAIVFPAIPGATDIAKQAFKGEGIDVTPFTVNVDEQTTFLAPVTDNGSKVDAVMRPTMDSIMSFKSDPQTALPQANKQVNALFSS
jgi:multiple sugar transport system substrate-binding protein